MLEIIRTISPELAAHRHHGRRRRREAHTGCPGTARANCPGLISGGRGPRRSGMKYMDFSTEMN